MFCAKSFFSVLDKTKNFLFSLFFIMAPITRGTEKCDEVISFLRGEEFRSLIASIVNRETSNLLSTISDLRREVNSLKESNIELVRLFDGTNFNVKPRSIVKDVSYSKDIQTKKSVSFAEATKTTSDKKRVNGEKPVSGGTCVIDTSVPSTTANLCKAINDPDWSTVMRGKNNYKKNNKKISAIIGSDKAVSSIKGVAKLCHLHVYRLDPAMTAEQLTEFLTAKEVAGVKCEQLKSKFPESYSSFKVSASNKFQDALMQADFWPEDVCVNRFFFRLKKRDETT